MSQQEIRITSPARSARPWHRLACASFVSFILHSVAVAQPSAIMQGPQAQVSADDLRAAGHRLPRASRQALMSRPDTVQRQAEDLYIRRLLAQEAERDQLDKDPVVQALIRQARERILSEARLVEIDLANLPSAADTEKAAREIYRLTPDRFKSPAQTRASHILIAKSGDPKADQERAEKILAELRAGADFATLARQQSADTASATRGGDLGWFGPGTMVKDFETAVDALKTPGELSAIVPTQFGLHIIRLDERRPAGQRSFDEVRADLEREVQAKVQAAARDAKVRQLLEGASTNADAIESLTRSYTKP